MRTKTAVFEVNDSLKAVIKLATERTGVLLLAKDSGLYLLAFGDSIEQNKLAYAEGCNPATGADWFEYAINIAGGDDFGTEIPLDAVAKIVGAGYKAVAFRFKRSAIDIFPIITVTRPNAD